MQAAANKKQAAYSALQPCYSHCIPAFGFSSAAFHQSFAHTVLLRSFCFDVINILQGSKLTVIKMRNAWTATGVTNNNFKNQLHALHYKNHNSR
jgi:hypothetical protein